MATSVLIPVAEYLATMYRPDCDYVDGEVQESNWGDRPHGGLQAFIATTFYGNKRNWGLRPVTELRVQVSPTRFRVPDVCAIRIPSKVENILTEPPLLCIEVLSPEDTISRLQSRFDDYLAMGVEHIWMVDPMVRRFWTVDGDGIHALKADAFTIPNTPVRIPLAEIHAELDDLAAGM